MSKTGRTSLHRLSFLVRKNTAKDQPPSFSYSSSSSEEAAPTVSSSFLTPSPASYSAPSPSSSSSSSSPAAPPSNKGSTTTPQKAAPGWRRSIGGFVGAWVPDEAVEEGGSGLGSEYEEEEGWRVLREERDELQTQLESLLDIDAAQRGLLRRLLDQLTRRDGKGEASAAADPSTDEVTSLQRLVEDSAEASLVVHLRHENLLLRQKLAARDGGKVGGDSGGMPATSAEVVEGGTTLKEKQRKGKDKARSRTASTVFLDWPRRRGSSEASDAEEQQQQQQQQARDESGTVPSDASQKSSKKNDRRSRTLSFLSKSSKSLDARSEANGAPLKGTADSADDDDKQSSQKGGLFKRKERRKTITLDSTTTPVLLSASSASFSGAGGARRGDLNGTSNSNPFVLALNDEAAKLKALLTEQENKCANLNDQLLRAAEQLAEKNRAIAVLNQENDRLSHCVATLEQQLSQMRSGLSDAYRTLRKDSSAPEPKNLPHDSSHGGNNRATITVNIGSSGSTSSSPEAVTRKGSEERRPHTARERNTYRELEPTNSAAAEEVDVLKGNAEAKKPSVRMVVDALEVRLSEVYNIKNLATPRTGKDSPYSARRPSTSRASGKHASTRGSAVPSPRSARGAGVAPSAGQGNNWADLDEESLADEMPEAFIESGEEEALDCFQQEEAGPFFVASPLLTSEGNNEGNNMNSGDIASVAERDRSTANNNEVTRQQYLCKKRLQVINELLATERRYASAMKTLIKARLVYLEPLNAREHGIVTWEEINTMFSNIEDIWTLSKAFLEKLEQRARSWQDKETDEGHSDPIISDILIETFPMMRIYYPYCYNRDQASALRRQLVRTNPLWQSFVRLCQNRPECNNLDLAAFLIMPVQRIPRYQLLLKELIKYTAEGHVDKEGVNVALSIIASIAKEIDRKGPAASAIVPSLSSSLGEKRRDSSGSLHLTPAFKGETAEPDEHLVGQHYHCMDVGRYDAFVDVTRSWIKSDAIRTVCGWKEQLSWLYLFDDMVLAHNAPTFSNNLWTNNPTSTTRFRKTRSSVFAKAKHDMFGKLLLSEVWIRDLPDSTGDRKHMWQLCAPDVTFIFVSRSQAEKTEWLQAIASAIEQLMLVPGHKEHRHAVLAEITLRGTQHGSVRVNRRRTVTRAVSFAVLNKDKIAAEKEQEDAKEEEAEENISAHMPEGVLYLARNFVRGGLAWRGEPVDASCKFDSGKKTVANRKEKESSLGRGVSGLEALFMVDGAAKSSLRDSDGGSMRDHQGSAAAGGGGSGGRKGSGDRDGGEGGGDGSRRKGAQPSSGKQSNSQRSGLFGRRSTTSHASLSQRDLSSSVTARSTTTIKSLAVAVPSPSSADSHSSGSGATTARATSKRRSLRRNLSSLGITELLQHQSSSNSNDRRLSTSPDSVRGRVIQKGFLYHRDQTAEGGWNRRWCVLTFERLAIYAGQQSSEELTAVSLKNATIDLCESARPSGMHSFKLCNGEEIILATALEAEAMAWVSRIQDLISVCG